MMPQLMTNVCLPNRNVLMDSLHRSGVKSYVNAKVLEVTDHDVKIQYTTDGREEWLRGFDHIVVGMGSRNYDPFSEELKKFVPEVRVIGDAVRTGLASKALHEGYVAGYEI